MRKKMIRLSEFEYYQIERAKQKLLKYGLDRLPRVKPVCPQCNRVIEEFNIIEKTILCKCGFKITNENTFTFGKVVGLGAMVILYLLGDGNKEAGKK